MGKDLKPKDQVEVFQKPFTFEEKEGVAKVKRVITRDRVLFGGKWVEVFSCDVIFLGEDRAVFRKIVFQEIEAEKEGSQR